ncbi:MAG TPA: glycosyltransferase family 2 protein [Solirubrobacterales bacterium]|nr:glycosyltransferase family 2 protein [Solirubrobacterales bacterium]
MGETISACVIARDEEERLPACLESLGFCDEVVVVDSGSRDRTREIAAAAGARVVENPWPGFGAQRNVALDHATGDWVLEIDADERVSPELGAEVRAFLADPPDGVRMTAIPMRDLFLGAAMGPASRYPRYRHRLFRRGAFRHDESRTVHEGLWPDGPTHPFDADLTHLLASSWGEALRDARAYARLEGSQRARAGLAEALTGVFVRPAVKLAYRTLLYGAWRDGLRGLAKVWLECAADALATVYRLRGGAEGGAGGFGQEAPRLGPVRVVGVALDAGRAGELAPWLERAAAAGADVALIAPPHSAFVPSGPIPPQGRTPAGVRCRTLDGSGPGALARALDAEDQLRPVDALLLAGPRERRRLRFAPAALRGAVAPIDPSEDAEAALQAVQDRTRVPRII